MQNIWLSWYNPKTNKKGSRPESVPDGELYQRILELKEPHFEATMPLNYGVFGFMGETIEVPLATNLYKSGLESARNWTKKLLESMKIDFKEAYSVGLFDATKRVMIVDKNGYHYATKGNPKPQHYSPKKYVDPTTSRCKKFPDTWSSNDDYDFFDADAQPQADAIMTDLPGKTLCVYSADCVIGLISDKEHHAVAVFHSMWKNLINEGLDNESSKTRSILEELVLQMKKIYQSDPKKLEVYLYPCVSRSTYEVDSRVAGLFAYNKQLFGGTDLSKAVVEGMPNDISKLFGSEGKYHLDLNKAASLILIDNGIKQENIYTVPFDTDDPEFPSLRNASSGRRGSDPQISSTEVIELSSGKPEKRRNGLIKKNGQNILIVRT